MSLKNMIFCNFIAMLLRWFCGREPCFDTAKRLNLYATTVVGGNTGALAEGGIVSTLRMS